MPYTYDDQLVEAAGVRRRRLVAAVLFRSDRVRRVWNPGVRTMVHSAFVAVLICAICVAVSFVAHLLGSDPALVRGRTVSVGSLGTLSPSLVPVAAR